MKRLLLSVFAAAITAAMVLPVAATASDVTLGGSYRLRGEFRKNPAFTSTSTPKSNFLQRARLTANAKANDNTTVKITIQDSRTWGANQDARGGPAMTDTGSSTIDVHEAYVKVKDLLGTGVSLTAGTQQIVLGDQRLVGAFGWDNNGRSFDALRFDYAVADAADLLFISSKVRESTNGDSDQDFYVAQATVKTIPNNTLDVYAMLLRDAGSTQMVTGNQAVLGTIDQVQTMWTYGGRLKGSVPGVGITYTAELAVQTGEINTTTANYNISALAYAIRAGYAIPNNAQKIKFGVEYAFASGDNDTTDTDIETFSNLFPTNHAHFGIADRQGWRNVKVWGVNASGKVTDTLSLKVAYWDFTRDEAGDGIYFAGDWNRAESQSWSDAGTKDDVGAEFDIIANYKVNSAVGLQFGYARYIVGDAIDETVGTNSDDQDFAYLQLLAKF